MVLVLAILEEDLVEVCICKLATGVHNIHMKMAGVQLELKLQITNFNSARSEGTMGDCYHRSSSDNG